MPCPSSTETSEHIDSPAQLIRMFKYYGIGGVKKNIERITLEYFKSFIPVLFVIEKVPLNKARRQSYVSNCSIPCKLSRFRSFVNLMFICTMVLNL